LLWSWIEGLTRVAYGLIDPPAHFMTCVMGLLLALAALTGASHPGAGRQRRDRRHQILGYLGSRAMTGACPGPTRTACFLSSP
jgi:hypothetical protein